LGDGGLGPIPNPHPQSPIPNPQSPIYVFLINNIYKYIKIYIFVIIEIKIIKIKNK